MHDHDAQGVRLSTSVQHGPLTRFELDRLPDDGRHELIAGALVVTPSPGFAHQQMVTALFRLLDAAAPSDVVVLPGPFDYVIDDSTVLVPDLLVAPRTAFTERALTAAPMLVVEVLSPSTALIDRNLKRAMYEAAGVPSYWLADPVSGSITGLELEAQAYVERFVALAGSPIAVDRPFSVTLG